MSSTVESLAQQFGAEVYGDRQLLIHGAQSLLKAGPHDISFMGKNGKLHDLQESRAGAVIVEQELGDGFAETRPAQSFIVVEDAQAVFIEVLQQFRPQRSRSKIGISERAFVSESVRIGPGTNVYPGASIDDDVEVGANCEIHPGVRIGAGCRIGDDVTLYPNAVLYPDVTLGNRVMVHAGAVLGADGFGYRLEAGRFVKIPHLGTVQVGDDVEIGACATIDRGMIGPTVIGEGTKIDNLVMIAHNCELGKHNALASQVGFAGSTLTGDYVRCAGQAGIAGHLRLGDGCTLGAKAAVHKDVPAGETHFGYPARRDTEMARILMSQTKVPEMRKRLRELESQLAELKAQMSAESDVPAERPIQG